MDNFYTSETERNFPLAFEMPIYYQQNFLLQQIRLLKYLYRPHNIYCIHIDKKSPKWWTVGLRQFTYLRSLSGVWFLNKYYINYDHVVMDCMEELLLKKHFKEYEVDCIKSLS